MPHGWGRPANGWLTGNNWLAANGWLIANGWLTCNNWLPVIAHGHGQQQHGGGGCTRKGGAEWKPNTE